jgi:hypothetical protein
MDCDFSPAEICEKMEDYTFKKQKDHILLEK